MSTAPKSSLKSSPKLSLVDESSFSVGTTMRVKLCVVEGQATKTEIDVDEFPMVIGRSRTADLPIAHAQISREHCTIDVLDGALVVRDNGSANGTFINKLAISEEILKPGDHLTIGPLTFVAVYNHEGKFPSLHGGDDLQVLESSDEEDVFGEDVWISDEADSGDSIVELQFDDLAEDSISSINTNEDSYEEQDEYLYSKAPPSSAKKPAPPKKLPPLKAKPDDESDHLSLPEFDSVVDPVVSERYEDSELGSVYEEVDGFPIRLQLTDAGTIQVGTAVQVAGLDVGYVYNLTWAEYEGELRAEALLMVQETLGKILREDVRMEVQHKSSEAVIVIVSPGKTAKLLQPDQVVLPIDFPTLHSGNQPESPLHKLHAQIGEDQDDGKNFLNHPSKPGSVPSNPRSKKPSPPKRRLN